ncbi:pathogenesis-related protein PRMS [Prunus persica]|uniref:pathogenesis-related protein PRMS n=1 Tax=Prunus persica TaxID=3760 RepID=UPI0009AB752F|nr:pathogenesis-related protein PRMS [Prunus persica]
MPRRQTFATIIITISILIPFILANPFHLPRHDVHINHVEKVTAKSNANPHANNVDDDGNGIGTSIGGIANVANDIVNGIANALKPNNENYTEYPPPALAQEFIMVHNEIRKAENVPPLVWNETLAQFAEDWAKKQTDCGMRHSKGQYGENLFWGFKAHWLPREAVEDWAHEKQFYNREKRQCAQDKACGHYTQIVWKTTQQVGCARFRCSNGSLLIICEYAPPGNYANEDPFNPGSPLSPPPTPSATSPPSLSSPVIISQVRVIIRKVAAIMRKVRVKMAQ